MSDPSRNWREAEGAAPRRSGDNVSPEEAIRRIRGHEPDETIGADDPAATPQEDE